MNQFIFEELTGMPTVLATNRAKRPDKTGVVNVKKDFDKSKEDIKTREKVDFFAKGNEHLTPPAVYQDQEDWNVRVIPNKFPILPDHEVIIHSPDPDLDISELPHEQNVKIIRAMLNRMPYYTSQDKEVFIFNNRGGKAGASLTHPHTQLVALRGFPGILETEKSHALRYYNEHDSCYWCDYVRDELGESKRVVYATPHFALMVPRASRWSYEMILIPKKHRSNFEYIDEVEVNDFARILKAALYAYDKLFGKPDRNFWIHTQRFDPFHWHVGFLPHIKVFGGLELGAGIWVSDKATPEDAASDLHLFVRECYEAEKTSIA